MRANGKVIPVLGSRINAITIPDVLGWIEQCIANHQKTNQLVVTGFHGTWKAFRNADYRAAVQNSDMWVPDGIAPVWIAKLRGLKTATRIPGADLMRAFFQRANQNGYKSFFYGDSQKTLDTLRSNLEEKYPGHCIVGTFSPPFRKLSASEEREHVRMINDARPDVLWVALGLPRQDVWIHRHRNELNVPVAAGVGAAFKFLAGTVERAPEWMGKAGLEWLWRLAHEPRKCWYRCLVEGPQFVFHAGLELTGLRDYSRSHEERE